MSSDSIDDDDQAALEAAAIIAEIKTSDSAVFDLDDDDDEADHRELSALFRNQTGADVEATQAFPAEDELTDHEHEVEDYSVYENKAGLADDMKFLASMPELCDVTFLVGETREPVCAVKAVLSARSR